MIKKNKTNKKIVNKTHEYSYGLHQPSKYKTNEHYIESLPHIRKPRNHL